MFRMAAVLVLIIFYSIYFGKMYLQKRQGIKTHQIGTRKEKKLHRVESFMSIATFGIVGVQILSIILNRSMLPSDARFTGFCVGMLGNVIFGMAVYTMRDSWRAGIPAQDETSFVSTGIYAYSRNPAFLGFDLMYIGVLLLCFNWLLLGFTIFAIVMLHLQILQEEKYLAVVFGKEYVEYRGKVFRYLGRR